MLRLTIPMLAMLALFVGAPAKAQFSVNFELVEAVEKSELLEARTLILQGATANARSGSGLPVLFIAAQTGNAEMVKMLLENGASVDLATRDNKRTALMDRAEAGDIDNMAALIEAGADIDRADRSGETPLMKAARLARRRSVEFLLEAGADPSLADYSGRTAADYARLARARTIVRMLEENGG